jgi:hypothetical protein
VSKKKEPTIHDSQHIDVEEVEEKHEIDVLLDYSPSCYEINELFRQFNILMKTMEIAGTAF